MKKYRCVTVSTQCTNKNRRDVIVAAVV